MCTDQVQKQHGKVAEHRMYKEAVDDCFAILKHPVAEMVSKRF
jgi:hypothetical protein